MMVANYTTEIKKTDNYVCNLTQKIPNGKVSCQNCFFVGSSNIISKHYLCGKDIHAVSIVDPDGTCDKSRDCNKWYNKYDFFNMFKQSILEKSGFYFQNR